MFIALGACFLSPGCEMLTVSHKLEGKNCLVTRVGTCTICMQVVCLI